MITETERRKIIEKQQAALKERLRKGEIYSDKPLNTMIIDTTAYKAPETGNYYAADRVTDPKRPQATLVPRYGTVTERTAEQLKARGIYKLRVTTEKPSPSKEEQA